MKKTSLVALVALTASVMADDMDKSNKNGQMQRPDSGMPNVSARPTIDSNNWFLFADATLWHAGEEGTEWAIANKNITTAIGSQHFHQVHFDWNWGFKVGLGYNMDHDQWDTQLYYTWFHTDKKESAGIVRTATATPNAGIDSIFTSPSHIGTSRFQSGSIDWSIHYSMFDWELGRNYLVSKHLALRPHVGVKGGWINQHVHGRFKDFNARFQTFHMDNDFWCVGPSGGVNTKWNLGNVNTHFFSLFGDFAGAFMWGHWELDQKQNDVVNFEQRYNNRSRNQGASMLQAFMGFGWDSNFHNDECHFGMKAGYEVQYWFAQNQLWNAHSHSALNGDLTLQGGTVEVRFDF